MREILIAGVLAATAIALAPATTSASTGEDLALCVAALDEKGIADADAYRPKFQSLRGGGVRRVSVLLIPNDGGAAIEAECRIKGGEVVDVAVKS